MKRQEEQLELLDFRSTEKKKKDLEIKYDQIQKKKLGSKGR